MAAFPPFLLEDFFYRYEHNQGLINLASSDVVAWTWNELCDRLPELSNITNELDFTYPDVKSMVVPNLRRFCNGHVGCDVLPTSGASEAIFVAMQEITSQSMNVSIAIPYPGYGAFEGISRMLGLQTKSYEYRKDYGWMPNTAELISLAEQCDVFVINNPHNPTGRLIHRDVITQIAEAAANHGGTLIVDEVLRLPEDAPSSLNIAKNVIVIGSLSKIYGLPGLRFGWIAGAADKINRMRTVQQYLSLSLNSLSAKLGGAVLKHTQILSRGTLLSENRTIVKGWAKKYERFIRIASDAAGTTVCLEIASSVPEEKLFEEFLKEKVLLVPGNLCFNMTGRAWFRLGYGTTKENLLEGLRRIAKVLDHMTSN